MKLASPHTLNSGGDGGEEKGAGGRAGNGEDVPARAAEDAVVVVAYCVAAVADLSLAAAVLAEFEQMSWR